MARKPDDWYRQRAVDVLGKVLKKVTVQTDVTELAPVEPDVGANRPGLELGTRPEVSKGTSPGAWVMAWVWIPDPLEGDEHGEEENEREQGRSGAAENADG